MVIYIENGSTQLYNLYNYLYITHLFDIIKQLNQHKEFFILNKHLNCFHSKAFHKSNQNVLKKHCKLFHLFERWTTRPSNTISTQYCNMVVSINFSQVFRFQTSPTFNCTTKLWNCQARQLQENNYVFGIINIKSKGTFTLF